MGGLREAILSSTSTTYCCCLLLNGARLRLRGVPGPDWLGYLCRMSATKQILLSHGFLNTIDLQLITTTPIHKTLNTRTSATTDRLRAAKLLLFSTKKSVTCPLSSPDWHQSQCVATDSTQLARGKSSAIAKSQTYNHNHCTTTAPPHYTTWTQKLAFCRAPFHAISVWSVSASICFSGMMMLSTSHSSSQWDSDVLTTQTGLFCLCTIQLHTTMHKTKCKSHQLPLFSKFCCWCDNESLSLSITFHLQQKTILNIYDIEMQHGTALTVFCPSWRLPWPLSELALKPSLAPL